jgi:hypothetical protein
MCPGVDSASKNEYQVNPGDKGGRCVKLTTYHLHVPMSRNLGTLTSWNPMGLFRPVMGQLLQKKFIGTCKQNAPGRLPGIIKKNCRPKGRRNQGRSLKRLLDVETVNGREVAQHHISQMMMIDDHYHNDIIKYSRVQEEVWTAQSV